MRFIHTADICLDRCYADLALPANVGRENRLHLRRHLQAILERARSWPADAVLISGNLFAQESVQRDTVAFLREAFEGVAPIPVLISPGNRDPFVPMSPYATELWPENVHIFSGPALTAFPLGDVTIYGFGYDKSDISINPFDGFDNWEANEPCIVMGAATASTLAPRDTAGKATVDLARLGLPIVYVALGDAATAMSVGEPDGPAAWYPGAPEGAGYSEPGPHHYLEVTIDEAADGWTARVTQIPISGGRFFEMTVDCTDIDSGQALIDTIRPHLAADPDRQCVRVILEGALVPAIYDEMASIQEALAGEVLSLDLVDRCFVAENYEDLAQQKTSLGAFVARINREIGDAPDGARHAALCRSRDLALCAYRGQHLPIRALQGD